MTLPPRPRIKKSPGSRDFRRLKKLAEKPLASETLDGQALPPRPLASEARDDSVIDSRTPDDAKD